MASLALLASLIVLVNIFIGPVTYILAKIKFPKFIIYILSLLCFFIGINFCWLPIPVWYIGLMPIYFGYISISLVNKKETQG